jgi:hypothetical protein
MIGSAGESGSIQVDAMHQVTLVSRGHAYLAAPSSSPSENFWSSERVNAAAPFRIKKVNMSRKTNRTS